MAEECADCGASFGSPAELVAHMNKAHAGGDAKASMEMNPESHIPGLECAACGARFATREALASHNLRPHTMAKRVKSRSASFT
jgi:uncharacterized C2H2 Zn-finger protein